MDEIEENGINIYSLPDCDSDEDESYKESCEELKVCVGVGGGLVDIIA